MKKLFRFSLLLAILPFALFANGRGEAKEPETIELSWSTWTLPTAEDFVILEKGFEALYPNVDLQPSSSQMDEYKAKLQAEFAAGSGPDLFCLQPGTLLTQYAPFAMDLTVPARDVLSKLVDAVVEDARVRSGGDKIAIAPMGSSSTMFVYYNATYFEKAGITKIPTDLASMKEAFAKLRKTYPDKLPLSVGLKDSWFNGDVFAMFANMVEPGITERADRGEVKWNAPQFVEAMSILRDLVDEGILEKEMLGVSVYEDSIGMWADGKAAMHFNGGWAVGMLSKPSNKNDAGVPYADRRGGRATDDDVFGAFPVPNFAGGKPVVLGGIDIGIAINRDIKEFKLPYAVNLLDYMLVGEGRTYETGRPGAGLIPTLKGASLNKSIYQDRASSEGVDTIVDMTNNNMAGPRGVANPAVFNQMGIVVQNVVAGKDVKAELDALQAVSEK